MGNNSETADITLQKAVVLLQKCKDMGLDYSDAKFCFDLAVKEYASERYQSAEDLFGEATGLMLNDIKARRLDIGCYRIRKACATPSVMLGDGVRLWPLFNGGSIGGIITPEMQSPCEYTGLIGEIQVEGGYATQPCRHNTETFYYILQGEGVMSLEGREMNVRTGDWVFIPNNWLHSIRPLSTQCPIRVFTAISYADRRTSALLPVGTDPLSLIKPATPYGGSAAEAMKALVAKTHEVASVRISADIGGSLYREADFYIEVAKTCFGKNDLGVQKYAGLAIDIVQRVIEDTKRWEAYKSDITKLKANIATFTGEWLHEATSIDWFIYADENYMKPEWNRPVTLYTQLLVEWETPAGKSFMPHTHNTEEIYYQMASVCGMKIGPVGTNKLTGDEKEFFLYPGDALFIPPNTKHVARSVSSDYPLHAIAVGSYTDEVVTGEAAVY